MRELGRVFANEWMKLMHRRRLWVALLLGALVVCGLTFLGYNNYDDLEQQQIYLEEEERNLKELQQQLSELNKQKDRNSAEKEEVARLEVEIQQAKENIVGTKEFLERNKALAHGDWKSVIREEIAETKASIEDLEQEIKNSKSSPTAEMKHALSEQQQHLKTLEYTLDNNIRPLPANTQTTFNEMKDLIKFTSRIFLPMLVVILIADLVSGETTSGTIKLLLVRPVSRTKILLGKWLVGLAATALLTLIFYALMFGANSAFHGIAGMDEPTTVNVYHTFEMQEAENPGEQPYPVAIPHYDKATIIPMWQYILSGVGLTILAMMAIATITFFCSTFFKSSMVSTGVAFALIIVGQMIQGITSKGKYIFWLFSLHSDLLSNWSGELSHDLGINMSLGLGLATLGAWTLIAIIFSLLHFTRRDVLNA